MADLTITVTINDTDQKCLKDNLLDIEDWVQKAVTGKISACWGRFHQRWTTRLMNDQSFTDPIPSNKTDFVNLILARPDYEDRAARDAQQQL